MIEDDSDWILSRKISKNSVTRHFAAWKNRYFVLDRSNGLLSVRNENQATTTNTISLKSPFINVKHHYYSNDKKFCLSLKYIDEEKVDWEIILKFEALDLLNKWNKVM